MENLQISRMKLMVNDIHLNPIKFVYYIYLIDTYVTQTRSNNNQRQKNGCTEPLTYSTSQIWKILIELMFLKFHVIKKKNTKNPLHCFFFHCKEVPLEIYLADYNNRVSKKVLQFMKTEDFEVFIQDTKVNPASTTQRVSGELFCSKTTQCLDQ